MKKTWIAVLTFAALFGAAFLLRVGSDGHLQSSREEKPAGSGSAGKFFEAADSELAAAQGSCKKSPELDEGDNLWTADDAKSFVSYDPKTRVVTVCDHGRAVAGVWPADPDLADFELIRVSDAGLEDMNGDGKKEFFLFQGQCADGPCLGFHHLLQVEGDKIRKLYTLFADNAVVVHERGRTGIFLQKNCYTEDFSPGPTYFAIAEFAPELKRVPFQQLRVLYPEATARLQPTNDLDIDDSTSPTQRSLLKVHDLVVGAYAGRPLPELRKELPPPESLNLYCDMNEILALISGAE